MTSMNEASQHGLSEPQRVLGEDAPRWLTVGFGVVGMCIAAAAAWLWLAQGSRPQEQPAHGVVAQPAAVSRGAESKPAAPATPAQVATTAPQAAPSQVPVTTEQVAQATAQSAPAQGPPVVAAALVGGAADPSIAGAEGKAAPAPTAAAPAEAPPQREDCPSLITVPFKFDSALLSQAELASSSAALMQALQSHPEAKLYVQGYADSAGWDQYNLLLSYRRARTVVALLNKAGVPAQRIVIRAAGSHEPVEGMPADAAANRRVTLQVMGIAGCA